MTFYCRLIALLWYTMCCLCRFVPNWVYTGQGAVRIPWESHRLDLECQHLSQYLRIVGIMLVWMRNAPHSGQIGG